VRIPSAAARAASDSSRAAEADGHGAVLDDDRDAPLALRHLKHPLEVGRVLLDVEILERDVPPGVVLTGGFRVGSRILAEDQHGHVAILSVLMVLMVLMVLTVLMVLMVLTVLTVLRPIYL
jgi:hypothetical protein